MKKLSKEGMSKRVSRPTAKRAPIEAPDPKQRPGQGEPEPNLDPEDQTEDERDNRSVKGRKGMTHP